MFAVLLLRIAQAFTQPDAPCVSYVLDRSAILTCSDGRRFERGWYVIVDSKRAIVLGYDR